jgi:hypothetical protein
MKKGIMNRRYAFAALAGALAILNTGCVMSMAQGARTIFSQKNTCPSDRITVRQRADVPPHTLLAPQASQPQPPPDVASDPERLALWNKMHRDREASIDDVGTTYEVSGCGQSVMYVCTHPNVAEVMTGSPFIVGDVSVVENDVIALSAVECVPPAGGAEQDVVARIQGPDVVHIPSHTSLPMVPDTLRGLRVLALDRIVSSQTAQKVDAARAAAAAQGANRGCAKDSAKLFGPLGWSAVFDSTEPHDIVTRSACTGNAAIATVQGAMYVLLPSRAKELGGTRIETPDGDLIDQLQLMPLTLACPTLNEAECVAAVKEYAAAHFIEQVVGSTKLVAYVAAHRTSP